MLTMVTCGDGSHRARMAVSHPTRRSTCIRTLLPLLLLIGSVAAPRPAAANSDISSGHITGIVLGIVSCAALIGAVLAGAAWCQQQRRRRLTARRFRAYEDVQELALETQLSEQQSGQDEEEGSDGIHGEGRPRRGGRWLSRAGLNAREEREGAGDDGIHHGGDGESREERTSNGSGSGDDHANSRAAGGAPAEAVTIAGVPIVNRVRPRSRPPKGTVIVRHEQHQIRINFNALPEIPAAEPPPLTAEELQRLEDEQNRVASPELYGRAAYAERRASAPASPVGYVESFSSALRFATYLNASNIAGRGGGSHCAGSNASVASGSFRPGTPDFNSPGAGSLGARQGSYADSIAYAAGAHYLNSSIAGGIGNNAGGYASSHDGGRSTVSGTARGSINGTRQPSQHSHRRKNDGGEREHRRQRRAGTDGGWIDRMESTSDDFDDSDNDAHRRHTGGPSAAAAAAAEIAHATAGVGEKSSGSLHSSHLVRHRSHGRSVSGSATLSTGLATPHKGATQRVEGWVSPGSTPMTNGAPPSPSVFPSIATTATAVAAGSHNETSSTAGQSSPAPYHIGVQPTPFAAAAAISPSSQHDVAVSVPENTPDVSSHRQRTFLSAGNSTASSRASSSSIPLPLPRAQPAATVTAFTPTSTTIVSGTGGDSHGVALPGPRHAAFLSLPHLSSTTSSPVWQQPPAATGHGNGNAAASLSTLITPAPAHVLVPESAAAMTSGTDSSPVSRMANAGAPSSVSPVSPLDKRFGQRPALAPSGRRGMSSDGSTIG